MVASTSTSSSASSKAGRDHDLAVLVEDEALAVEDQLVLGAHGVHEHDPARARGSRRQHLLALGALADVEGRGRDVRDDVRAREREIGRRRPWFARCPRQTVGPTSVSPAEQHETTPGLK